MQLKVKRYIMKMWKCKGVFCPTHLHKTKTDFGLKTALNKKKSKTWVEIWLFRVCTLCVGYFLLFLLIIIVFVEL